MKVLLVFKVFILFSFIILSEVPYVYLSIAKKWPINATIIFGTLLPLIFAVIFVQYFSFPLINMSFAWTQATLVTRFFNRFWLLAQTTKNESIDEITTKLQDLAGKAPYYISFGIDLNAPNYFSWEPIFDPIKISKQKITAIYIDYKVETKDPSIKLVNKEVAQKCINENPCLLYIPEGCSVPLWLKFRRMLVLLSVLSQYFGLGGFSEFFLNDIDVKFFKLRKVISSDPKAYKHSSIVSSKEQPVIVEE